MIYLLSNNDSLRRLLLYALENQGFAARDFSLPSAFWRAAKAQRPSLVLLDLSLPEEDGMHVLRRLRASEAGRRIPVIMLSEASSEYDRVLALDAGADDFITQPFGMLELLARVRAVLRRVNGADGAPAEYRLGSLALCPARRSVQVDGSDVQLTNKEFTLLCLLCENLDLVLTRGALMDRIWGLDCERENRTLDVHIRTLRVKLGKVGSAIKTVRGVGYQLSSKALLTQ